MTVLRWLLILGTVSGCVTTQIPVQEYTLAKAAYEAADAHEAVKFAPHLFLRMEKTYKKAELLYKERYYEEARREFIKAQKLAEKAETLARVKEFNSGDMADE